LLLGGSAPLPGHAQDLVPRLELWRAKRAINTSLAQTASDAALNRKLSLSRSGSQPFWVVVAQIEPPVGKGATDPTPEIFEGSAPPAPRGIGVYTDFSMGFDKQSAVVDDPAPREVQIRRRIRILNISAEVPLARRTNLAVALPVISQSTRYRVGAGTFTQRGSGVGDLTLQLERRGRESARGVERAIALGLVLPTGKDPFNLSASQLPTGNGFYQPFVRLSTRKLRVPLQLFASVNYGKGLPRTVGGQRLRLPASYGGEVGFSYVIGPEFSVSTSVNANRVSSPLLLGPSQSVAYLSQSLSYNANEVTVLRASVDVGLTDDSTDAFAGLSLRRAF
jgi:hypothetical protein